MGKTAIRDEGRDMMDLRKSGGGSNGQEEQE